MSLYDGLDIEEKSSMVSKTKADVSGWGSSIKMLQTQKQLQEKSKANLLQPRKRGGTTLAPVIDLKRTADEGEVSFNFLTGRMEKVLYEEPTPPREPPSPAVNPIAQFIANEPYLNLTGVPDEYDPFNPNEYEEFSKKRREERRAEERRKEQTNKKSRQEKKELVSRYNSDSDDEEDNRRSRRRDDKKSQRGGAAIAPPSSILEDVVPADENMDVPAAVGSIAGASVASKIMARMGYKQGQGLGKKEQGMSTALQVEKTSKRGGKIIHEKDIKDMPPPEVPSISSLMKNPTKVILLQNMVSREDVDEELEPETAEECTKYGKVNRCVIHEMPPESSDYDSVRIFIEFDRMESAIKGVIDLNGRYFGGRVVNARFYNLDRFRRLELEDTLT